MANPIHTRVDRASDTHNLNKYDIATKSTWAAHAKPWGPGDDWLRKPGLGQRPQKLTKEVRGSEDRDPKPLKLKTYHKWPTGNRKRSGWLSKQNFKWDSWFPRSPDTSDRDDEFQTAKTKPDARLLGTNTPNPSQKRPWTANTEPRTPQSDRGWWV